MKSTRLVETATSQNICLFCLHRPPLQHRSTHLPTFRLDQARRISRTHAPQEPPAEAVARREDESQSSRLEPSTPPRRWHFSNPARATSEESLPDPDLPQRPSAWRVLGQQSSRTAQSFPDPDLPSFPDPDLPLARQTTGTGLFGDIRTPRPSPRWDESLAGTSNGSGGQRSEGQGRMGNTSDGPRIKWSSVRGSAGAGPARYDGGAGPVRYDGGPGRAVVRGSSMRQGWGRHLNVRKAQLDRAEGKEDDTRKINPATVDAAEPKQAAAPSVPASRFNFRQLDREQRGFVSFKNSNSSAQTPSTFESTSEHPRQRPDLSYFGSEKFATSVDELKQNGIRPGEADPVATSSSEEENKTNQGMFAPEIIRETVSESKSFSLEERREARAKKGKRGGRFGEIEEVNFVDDTPKRRSKKDVPKRRQEAFQYQDEAFEFQEELDFDEDAAFRRKKQQKKKRQQEKLAKQAAPATPTIELPPFISVEQLATALHVRLDPFIEKMEELGFEEIGNDHVLNFENSSLIAMEYGYEAKSDTAEHDDLKARPAPEDVSLLPPRPPIVTIMGHVDHGKTTLLDYLRKSSVAASEHGGITQHIGAFSVPMASGKVVTFLDTPGHAAFLSMRQRGANVTDIVVLVVAADDSVKPQTLEAIKHARSAKVPIIVAINKVDKDEADIQRVKQDLLRHEIEVEDFGGDVQAIPVSGKTGQGMEELEEALVALAETIDMRAETDGLAEGWVLEATTSKAGRVATVLVRRGTLRPGDVIVAGTTWARVRTLRNEAGVVVSEAPPGTPVEVDGWRDQPAAGDEVLQAPNEQKATSVVDYRVAKLSRDQDAKDMEAINEARQQQAEKREREKAEKEALSANASASSTDAPAARPAPRGSQIFNETAVDPSKADSSGPIELYILIKADVSGSAEAIESSLLSIPLHSHPITLSILRSAVGPISESDVAHISAVPANHGFLISFNQPVPQSIAHQAEMAGVKVFDENIIYKVIDNVRAAVEDHLPPLVTKRVTGEAEGAQVFEINVGGRKFVKVLGCKVRNGTVGKGKKVRVYRGGMDDSSVVYEGTINSLKSQKKDVGEMRKGTECGMGFEAWEGFAAGDVIQCYEEKSEKRRLV